MHRLLFWGSIILFVVVVGLIVDQVFYRLMRLFFKKHRAKVIRLLTFIVTVVIIVSSCLIGHFHTRTHAYINNVVVQSLRVPASFDGFKIAHISDFHIDSFDSKTEMSVVDDIVAKILRQKPDVVCFTGDIVTNRSAQLLPYRKVLARLAATDVPVYCVMGNHDYADYVWDFDEAQRQQDRDSLRLIIKEMGWQMLDNTCAWMKRGNDSILVAGVENIGEPPFTTYGNLSKAMSQSKSETSEESADLAFTILLSHNPSHWRKEVLPDTDIDLMLAGHTHSMQLNIFGWSPSKYTYQECQGLYREGNQYLYVNTGLGCTGPRIRIGVRPEITIITLRK